jgi:hypothetical protein
MKYYSLFVLVLTTQAQFVYYYSHGVYNNDYKLTDYFYTSTDDYHKVYYNTGAKTIYGIVYQVQYDPLKEYYTFKRSYDAQYDTVYFMEKDDHYGKYTEYNERYN